VTRPEVECLLKQVPRVPDDRNPADNRRRGRFGAGWEDCTVRGEEYGEVALRVITWQNLGYRFGKLVGPRTESEIEEIYFHLDEIQKNAEPDAIRAQDPSADDGPFLEGASVDRLSRERERNALARKACITAHGSSCSICGMNFGQVFGAGFEGFIHVHHLRPLASAAGEREVEPAKDLVPVCPNCHAVIHYGGTTRSIDEVRALRAPVDPA
jgi:hypothetical protein